MARLTKRCLGKHESLESRCLLAGDVTIIDNSFGGTLEIIGDDVSNGLVVQQGETSTFSGSALLISPIATFEGPTTINGSSNPFFIELYNYDGEIRFVNTDLGGGDDFMVFEDVAVIADVNIETGDGNDDIEFWTTQVAGSVALTGAGVDAVTIDTFYSIGDVTVVAEQLGDIDVFDARIDGEVALASTSGVPGFSDNVSIAQSFIGSNVSITMNNAGGASLTDGSTGGSVTIDTLSGGNHDINIERHNIFGNLDLSTRGGADQIHLGGQSIAGSVAIITSGGNDNVTFDSLEVDGGSLVLNTGGGSDTVYAENGAWQSIDIRTGGGNDNLTLFDPQMTGGFIRAGGGNDQLVLDGLEVSGLLTIAANRGDDQLTVQRGEYGSLRIGMGRGTDTLNAGDVIVSAASTWNGGGGTDTYNELAANFGLITIQSFENSTLSNHREARTFTIDELFRREDWLTDALWQSAARSV